jgi:UDPglucose 6-dehydrogenase
MRIAVIGSGYVGLVAGACLAEIGHEVVLVDNDPAKYSALSRGEIPIHEQHLPELLARWRGDRLCFSASVVEAVQQSEVVFIAVGTPPMGNGDADLSYVESVACEISAALTKCRKYKVIAEKSTVPVYTSEWIRKVMLLNGAQPETFDVASTPEFLREGTAVTDFLYPDRIVIGADTDRCMATLQQVYQPLADGTYARSANAIPSPRENKCAAPPPIIATSARSAELIKHASNGFLAMKISFINAVANICELAGADIEQVRQGIGSDSRIGTEFLNPGIGYGGSCFPKDTAAFLAVARDLGYNFRLLDAVMRINEDQRQHFLRKVRSVLWTLKGKRVAVLGLAFKGGTDDIRESPALSIIESLLEEGCTVAAYDPAAMERSRQYLPEGRVQFAASAYEAAEGADALLVLTDWKEFKNLDLARIREKLRYPIVVDGRNLFSPTEMEKAGLMYLSIGRAEKTSAKFGRYSQEQNVVVTESKT